MKPVLHHFLTVFGIVMISGTCILLNMGCGEDNVSDADDDNTIYPVLFSGDSMDVVNALETAKDTVVEMTANGLIKIAVDPNTLLTCGGNGVMFWGILEVGEPIPPSEFFGFITEDNDSTKMKLHGINPEVLRIPNSREYE